MTERTLVNLTVEEDQRDRWHEYADEHFENLSHLIRFAVEKEINGDGGGDLSGDSSEELAKLSDSIRQVSGSLDQMHGRLNDIERQIKQDSPEIQELANDVFEVLPTEGELITDTHESVIPSSEESGIGHVVSGRIDHIATRLGVSDARVGEAIQKLQEDTSLVGSKKISGHTRYYKEV